MVVAASRRLVRILVDCTEKGSQTAIKERYGLKYYPFVLFLDADGQVLEEMKSRCPEDVSAQMERIARSHDRRETAPARDEPVEVPVLRDRVVERDGWSVEFRGSRGLRFRVLTAGAERATFVALDAQGRTADLGRRAGTDWFAAQLPEGFGPATVLRIQPE